LVNNTFPNTFGFGTPLLLATEKQGKKANKLELNWNDFVFKTND
jgi:hypothetical protein